MRKLISLLLALAMVFSLAIVASAAEEGTYTDMDIVTVTKTYNATNENTTSPAETFSFSALTCTNVENAGVGVTAEKAPVPTIASVAYTAGEAGSENKTKVITISLPEYSAVGIYTYTFSEVAGDTAGVTYYGNPITLVVTVVRNEEDGKIRVAAVHTEENIGTDNKSSDFANEYSAGSLAVKKIVTGMMGDTQKDFSVTVTFMAPTGKTVKEAISYTDDGEAKTITANWSDAQTVTIDLKHDETVTFTNIPYGVTYTVVENDYTEDGYDGASYKFSDEAKKIDSASDTVDITNKKDGQVDTGITLDSIPFVLILAVCAGAAVLFLIKRRSVEF